MNRANLALIAGQITAMSLLMWGCKTLDLSKYDIPIPIKPVTTTTTTSTTTTTQPAVITAPYACTCPAGKGSYNSNVREVIITGWLPCELRALLNDSTDGECGIADLVKKANAAQVVDGKLYANCFKLPDGSWAHYVGMRQPSSSSRLVTGWGVPCSKELLRLYFEGRK